MADLYSQLPAEIKQAIFRILLDDNEQDSLVTVLRVSKSWFANGVPVLYRVLTDLQGVFGALGSPNIDKYLSSICHIVFEGRCYTEALDRVKDTTLTLPKLRFISVAPPS